MTREKDEGHKLTSYYLSPRELEDIYRKYGRPGEVAPGQPAARKRSRLDAFLASLDRKDNATPFNEEDELEPDAT
ncbi:MAG: hypothetical protein K6T29_05915 [Peptococcaceae bacterium]|nr:hypothetical protein [Peptococcaceae bacterium]